MKKLLLTLCSMVLLSNAFSQMIPNGGFESWTFDTLYEKTNIWTSIYDESIFLAEYDVLLKSTDAQDGNYSVYLANDTVYSDSTMSYDSLFSYVFQGTVGDNGPDGGIPYTSDIDSITGYYKANMQPGDSALVIIAQFSDVDTIFDFLPIGGVQSSWSRFTFPLTAFSDTLESVFIGFVSSNPNIDSVGGVFHPDSWIMFDNVAFTSVSGTPAAIPDHSFEDWNTTSFEDPDDWFTLNEFSAYNNEIPQVTKTNDAFTGNSAMKLTTTYNSVVGGNLSVAGLGNVFDGQSGVPYDKLPTNISGYYKYNEILSFDSAIVIFQASRWDSIGDSTKIVMDSIFLLGSQSTYTQFSIDLDTSGLMFETVDSINILFISNYLSFFGFASDGSELYIDDLSVSNVCGGTTSIELFADDTLTIYDTTTTITADNGYVSYQWSTGGNNQSVSVNGNSMVSLTVSDIFGCEISDQIYVEYLDTTSSSMSDELLQSIIVYPNPATSNINLGFGSNVTDDKEIIISDLLGNKILSTFVRSDNESINISEWPSGVYFMSIRIGEEQTTFRVVKK